jgi:hypothetical protein
MTTRTTIVDISTRNLLINYLLVIATKEIKPLRINDVLAVELNMPVFIATNPFLLPCDRDRLSHKPWHSALAQSIALA